MKIRNLFLVCLSTLFVLVVSSCSEDKRIAPAQNLVINEIMPSNRTGLLNEKGKTSDWIEIKNMSADSINLDGFQLALIKPTKGSPETSERQIDAEEELDEEIQEIEGKNKQNNEAKELTWSFPSVMIRPGECLLIFAEKEKKAKSESKSAVEKRNDEEKRLQSESLTANFKLPKEGGKLQIRTPQDEVITEVEFGNLLPDQSLALQADSTYNATYWQTPGFENDEEGYEAYVRMSEGQRNDPLKIWEVMSRAKRSDDNWVELKNTGDEELDLSAYSLTKKKGKSGSWNLPKKTLKPGEIVTLRFTGKEGSENSPLSVPFKLGASETLILTKEGKFVDGANAKPTLAGGSIGRSSENLGFFYFVSPTRGLEKNTDGKRFIANMPVFNYKPGVYPKEKKLTLLLQDTSAVVHYTLDGSEPTMSSPIVEDSLVISKSTVIRTFSEGDSMSHRSRTATASYLIGAEHNLPVVSISVNPSDMYDYQKGIYAKGPGFAGSEWPHVTANYWKKWTKDAHIELFDGKEGVSVDCGLKIFGGFSRCEAKKSFCLKFKGKYGDSKVEYDFFDNGNPIEMKDLVLRSGSQDYNRCMLRDEFFTSLMKENSPAILTQMYRPIALYINGDYFGLYYIREKIDKNFVSRQLNVPNDSVNIIMSIGYNEEGSAQPYKDLIQYVSSHDLRDSSNYEYMKNNVDLEGLIDYKLGEIYSGNKDVGNIRYVRSTSAESDKKWHFVFYDLDVTWNEKMPGVAYYLSPSVGNVSPHNIMISRLLQNTTFRKMFLERLSHHMTHTFSEENATKVFDNLVERIRSEMKQNCKRWPQLKYEKWESNIKDFRKGFKTRNKNVLKQLRSYLRITDEENQRYFSHLGF